MGRVHGILKLDIPGDRATLRRMVAAIPFPDISPEIFTVALGQFAFSLRWYALAYIVGLLLAWRLMLAAVARPGLWHGDRPPADAAGIEDLMTAVVLGVVLGGRLGFVLFYQPAYYLAHPVDILKVWQGGMSFHGGFLGVMVGGLWFWRRHRPALLGLGDLMALSAPAGLMLGRIANFINAELWGRPSDLPWAVIFPGAAAQACATAAAPCARHPSQLYEAGLEGLVLGLLLVWLAFFRGSLRRPGLTLGVFLAGYGLARMIVELFRQADAQFVSAGNPWGHVIQLGGGAGLTMGQILSLPMLLAGLALVLVAVRRP